MDRTYPKVNTSIDLMRLAAVHDALSRRGLAGIIFEHISRKASRGPQANKPSLSAPASAYCIKGYSWATVRGEQTCFVPYW